MNEWELRTDSVEATERVGECIGARLEAGDRVLLRGELGAGKTALVRGIARGLHLSDPREVASPTFALVHVYEGGRLPIVHADLYRIEDEASAIRQGVLDGLSDPRAVSLIEWPERCPSIASDQTWEVRIEHGGEDVRRLHIRGPARAASGFSDRPRDEPEFA